MRQKQKVVNAIEFGAVDIRSGRKILHVLQTDGRLLSFFISFTDQSGPHRIVQLGEGFGGVAHLP